MSSSLPDQVQRQLVTDFLLESFEGLDRFDQELLVLEKGTAAKETLNVIFRVIHTIKGTAGCIGLDSIEATAHVGENILSLLREGQIVSNAELITALLALSDALRGVLRHIESHGDEGRVDHTALIARLQQFQPTTPAQAATPAVVHEAAPREDFGFFDAPVEAEPPSNTTAGEPTVKDRPSISETAIRVEVLQLDRLMNLVGELVLARNQIIQNITHPDPAALLAASQRLNLITTELQGSVMKTRMQPIGNIWSKFPRVVRDLAHELSKKILLTMEGQETELDRTILEAIKDPLTHILRNAVDHGIESPDARIASGKPEEGRLTLRAFHEGGKVNIEFTDDGQGINIARVKAKAIERNLISVDQAARLTEREAFHLIFLPGFSTAENVSNISGRGVGMDVVKTNIEKIGGSVDIQSAAGQGTTLKIKIPLTLAIIPALIVTSGGERFAIPQVNLLELVRLEGEEGRRKIETLYNAPVYRLRGHLLPLVNLNAHLHLQSAGERDTVNIVVLQADGRQFGLIVDAINDAEEIVVKPLGKQLKGLACFAGATIMGDGRVALILDVLGVAQQARVIAEARERGLAGEARTEGKAEDRQALLLFEMGHNRPMALPLSSVARLEELPVSGIEHSGGQRVVQYRGQIMPLIMVEEFLGGSAPATDTGCDHLQVVVHAHRGRSVGLVVSRISDIVHETLTVKRTAVHGGILGSAVIQQRVTDLLDIDAILRAADPAFDATGSN